MRTTTIVAALVATFNSALADVVCNSETLHYKPRMVSTAEKEGFSRTIDEVCNDSIDKSLQRQFESSVFSRTRTEDSFSEEECIANLHSVLEKCIFGKNARGGSLVSNELMVEVSLDPSNDRHKGVMEKRASKSSGSKPIPKLKPKPVPAKPAPAKPAPVKPTPAKPTPVKTPPAGQACKLKPGKGKGNGTGKGDQGKKTPTKVIRDLISKLFRRAGSESGCDLEDMTDGGEWGVDTWRGVKLLISNTMTNKALRDVAKAAFDEVMLKRRGSGGIVVAALFVPGRGVYIGTPAHGNGPARVESFAKTKAPFWWELMEFRAWDGKGSKYHAEDVAMLLAIESGAAKGTGKFPPGSKIAAWGRVGTMPTDKAMQPCTNGNILPGCMENIDDMGIESAYSG